MDEFIKREDALKEQNKSMNLTEMRERLKRIPPADVKPVVHGRWVKSPECPEEYDICSVCGLNDKHRSRGNREHGIVESVPPFCKWCGADMRGGGEDEMDNV